MISGGWTPCDSSGAVSKAPGKKKSKFHACVEKEGFEEDVLKCVNWKKGWEENLIEILKSKFQGAEKKDLPTKPAKTLVGMLFLSLRKRVSSKLEVCFFFSNFCFNSSSNTNSEDVVWCFLVEAVAEVNVVILASFLLVVVF